MNSRALELTVIALVALLVAACAQQAGAAAGVATPAASASGPLSTTVFESMAQVVMPRSSQIWELAGKLTADDRKIDVSQLSAEQWKDLAAAASAMRDTAAAMATAGVKVAPAGVKLQDESTPGAFGAAQVQAAIDADPQGFRQEAQKLRAIADELATATAARDGAKVDAAAARLSDVCEACHTRFWYPNQPKR